MIFSIRKYIGGLVTSMNVSNHSEKYFQQRINIKHPSVNNQIIEMLRTKQVIQRIN